MWEKRASKFIKPFVPPIVTGLAMRLQGREWHRERVGGMWDEIGRLQLEFLISQGLKPEHKLLDIGCGSLRGGVHFIQYLNDGNYFGVDKDKRLLEAGFRIELPRYELKHKTIHLVQMNNFDFSILSTQFDFALAQSLFTHLSWYNIVRCIINVEKALVSGGHSMQPSSRILMGNLTLALYSMSLAV